MNLDIELTPNFHLKEFLCPGAEKVITPSVIENLRSLAQKLEDVRKRLGNKPIAITSGYRTPAHNRAVGGASRSQHLFGTAADIVVSGMTAKEVQAALKDWPGGMGLANGFTHLDMAMKRRWTY